MNTRKIGDAYERKAAEFLIRKGYRIFEQNYRCRAGEIDIIAGLPLKEDLKEEILMRIDPALRIQDCSELYRICFVEVKYRRSLKAGYPQEAVGYRKQQRILRAAQWYLAEHGMTDWWCRFDVVGMNEERIWLITDAFRP